MRGSVFDVAVDIRKGSPTFGKWVELSEENHWQLWVPPGFAHGFVVTSDNAVFLYKTTDFYAPEYERCIAWNDQVINITWSSTKLSVENLLISRRDRQGRIFEEASKVSDFFDPEHAILFTPLKSVKYILAWSSAWPLIR